MGKTPGQKAARVKGVKMSESEILRKIAVIFVTDVVGFSTLMAQNEELTLRSFRSCKEILDNLFEEHSGRIFNTAGDSVLAEFPSAVSAVICAVEFQKLIKARNASVPNAAQMQFRIGLNMGDVIIEGTNLYGDGVNVAARLEALSQAGGVCLSKSIHDFVSQKVDLGFQDIGAQQVKNTNVHAFDVSIGGLAPRQIAPTPPHGLRDTHQSVSTSGPRVRHSTTHPDRTLSSRGSSTPTPSARRRIGCRSDTTGA